jgi:Rrf2 family protein
MQFLSKILQVFVRKGILTSVKGPAGGFRFIKDPYKVTLFDVVEIIDGTNMFEACIVGTRPCNSADNSLKKCPVHDEYSAIRQEIVSFFKKETIGDIVNNFESKEKLFLEL